MAVNECQPTVRICDAIQGVHQRSRAGQNCIEKDLSGSRLGLSKMAAGRRTRKLVECQAGKIRSLVVELQREGELSSQRMMYLGTWGLETGEGGLKG